MWITRAFKGPLSRWLVLNFMLLVVIAVGMADREGYHITFGGYFKVAFPVMLLTIAITTVYVIFMYLI